jgi:hypothetical protein
MAETSAPRSASALAGLLGRQLQPTEGGNTVSSAEAAMTVLAMLFSVKFAVPN